jgi:CRISPR/Cas system CMR-associated protein Cmr1 (group 7 of RAMP superfamily)
MTKTIGNFKIDVGTSGYPAWCTLQYMDQEFRMNHTDLKDLKYAVESMMKSARLALPDLYKDQV